MLEFSILCLVLEDEEMLALVFCLTTRGSCFLVKILRKQPPDLILTPYSATLADFSMEEAEAADTLRWVPPSQKTKAVLFSEPWSLKKESGCEGRMGSVKGWGVDLEG